MNITKVKSETKAMKGERKREMGNKKQSKENLKEHKRNLKGKARTLTTRTKTNFFQTFQFGSMPTLIFNLPPRFGYNCFFNGLYILVPVPCSPCLVVSVN
jgi:hypothetical protein